MSTLSTSWQQIPTLNKQATRQESCGVVSPVPPPYLPSQAQGYFESEAFFVPLPTPWRSLANSLA